jgi:hypothetical protein
VRISKVDGGPEGSRESSTLQILWLANSSELAEGTYFGEASSRSPSMHRT